MKQNFFVFLFCCCLTWNAGSQAQAPLRKIENKAFKAGEILEYRIHYGFVDAGEARLEVRNDIRPVGNRPCFHVVGTGRTKGAFDWFFKVRDRYETYLDVESMMPWIFVRRVDEGGYTINQDVTFNHYKNTASSQKVTIPVPRYVQDLVSAFYYARTLDFKNAKPGDLFAIDAYLDDEVFPLTIKYIGKEQISTRFGIFNCIKFRPMLLEGRVFKEEEDMEVWISDDENKIVIRAEAQILVGSIQMDLKGYSGLANPMSAMIRKSK